MASESAIGSLSVAARPTSTTDANASLCRRVRATLDLEPAIKHVHGRAARIARRALHPSPILSLAPLRLRPLSTYYSSQTRRDAHAQDG